MVKKILTIIIILFSLSSVHAQEESITITTYYPSPYGVYNQLQTNSFGVGDNNGDGVLNAGDVPTTTGDVWIKGNVGIGTTNPNNRLSIGTQANPFGVSDAGDVVVTGGDDSRWALYKNEDNSAIEKIAFETNGDISLLNGNVGIGTTAPGYTLTVNGTAWCTSGAWSGSDLRWKENIAPLANPLEKISRLRGVEFDWKQSELKEHRFPEGRQIGIIAQELEKEFPELVTTDNNGYKAIAYDRFAAVLLEAVKAQQQQIEGLKAEINHLKKQL